MPWWMLSTVEIPLVLEGGVFVMQKNSAAPARRHGMQSMLGWSFVIFRNAAVISTPTKIEKIQLNSRLFVCAVFVRNF